MLNLGTRAILKYSNNNARIQSRTVAASFLQSRTIVTLKNHKYTASATARGKGRNGEVQSEDMKLRLASPTALGGKGDGQNPEQLFAMGYSSCLLGAIQAMAAKMGKKDGAKDAVVHAKVHIGEPEELGGFGIAVDIKVEGVDDEAIIQAGHDFCPYSRALKHGAIVNVGKA